MTKVEEAIKTLSRLIDDTRCTDETKQSLRLAIDILSQTRMVTWLCSGCDAVLHCEYYNLDPSEYEVVCPGCKSVHHVTPAKTLYDVSTVRREP